MQCALHWYTNINTGQEEYHKKNIYIFFKAELYLDALEPLINLHFAAL